MENQECFVMSLQYLVRVLTVFWCDFVTSVTDSTHSHSTRTDDANLPQLGMIGCVELKRTSVYKEMWYHICVYNGIE